MLLAPVAQVAQVAHRVVQADHVRQVPVAQVPQALVQVSVAVLVQASAVPVQVLAQALQPVVASVVLVRVPVVVAAVVAQQAHSVRVVHVVHRRPASRSVRNAKSLNKEWLQASVAQLCHVAMALPSSVYVVEQASRTSPTRLMPMLVS